MTSKNAAQRDGDREVNLKIDPAPHSNTEKEPDDWVSGDDPMMERKPPILKPCREECGQPDSFELTLTKAEASKSPSENKLNLWNHFVI